MPVDDIPEIDPKINTPRWVLALLKIIGVLILFVLTVLLLVFVVALESSTSMKQDVDLYPEESGVPSAYQKAFANYWLSPDEYLLIRAKMDAYPLRPQPNHD